MTFPWPLTVMNTLFSQKKTSSPLVSVAPFSLALPLIAPSNPESALPQSLEVGVPGDPTVAFACPAHSHGSSTSQLLKNPNSVMLPISAHSPRSHWYICCILGFLYLNAPKKSICSKLVLFLKSLPSFIPSSKKPTLYPHFFQPLPHLCCLLQLTFSKYVYTHSSFTFLDLPQSTQPPLVMFTNDAHLD